MADYRRNNRFGGNRNFGKPRFNRDREQGEMYKATCANCGKPCEVPFKPTGSKPVLCRECFQNSRGSDERRFEKRSFEKPRFDRGDTPTRPDYRVEFEKLNAKMDKILSLLAQKPEEKPVLESEMNEASIDEIADEVVEEKEKPKKTRSSSKKK
jgi:CxxC-x17-CxxC domain-containing protein